jgi:predicted Rossmann fold nucleotide-binding protein DprA/Smf involved in DNA uptake
MLGAVNVDGTAIGIMADRLSGATVSQKYRDAIRRKNLVLISAYHPDAGFNIGNAMGRNKLVYCLSEAAIAVQSGTSGGTWSGALENLDKQWVPLLVVRTQTKSEGTSELVRRGGQWISEGSVDREICRLFASEESDSSELGTMPSGCSNQASEIQGGERKSTSGKNRADLKAHAWNPRANDLTRTCDGVSPITLYEAFCSNLATLLADGSRQTDELAQELGLVRSQLNMWLKRACEDGMIVKRKGPVRYELNHGTQGHQVPLFQEEK